MTDLLNPENPRVIRNFRQFGLNTNVLALGLAVKLPPKMEEGKQYDVVLRQKPCALDSKGGSENYMPVEDESLLNYNPGWPTKAPPFDARFPHQNQLPNCERNYIDYHRCKKIKGEDYEHCNYFKKVYLSRCPSAWIQNWDEQVENGTLRHKI